MFVGQPTESGSPQRFLVQVQDVTQRRALQGKLQFEADHDPMTGLPNRRGFGRKLDRHVENVRRYETFAPGTPPKEEVATRAGWLDHVTGRTEHDVNTPIL